jgi:hypothetical protein
LRDIVDAIAMIEQFTSGMDFEAFRSNPKTVAAVERKLQIISEAATRLGSEAEQRIPINRGGTSEASETNFAMRTNALIWARSGSPSPTICRNSRLPCCGLWIYVSETDDFIHRDDSGLETLTQ